MVAAINVRAEVGAVTRLLNSIAAKTPQVLANAVLRGALYAEGEIKRTINTEMHGRGGLARSFRSRFVGGVGADVSAEAYSDLVYARIQEDGGVIRPKHRKALAVPLRSAKVPPGKWPRHFPRTGPQALHLIPRRGESSLLAQVSGGRVKPIFALVDSVAIKPRHYVARTAEKIAPEVQAIVADALGSALKSEGAT